MKRLIAITGLVVLVAAIVAALSVAAPTAKTGPEAKLPPKPRLPALPAEVRAAASGRSASSATPRRSASRTRVAGTAATTWRSPASSRGGRSDRGHASTSPARRPRAASRRSKSKRVDMIISTLTWTAAREQQIDYSLPYYGAVGRLLVRNDTTVGTLRTWMAGKRVASTSGSIYNNWITNCFRDTTFQVISSPSAGVLALKNGQVDAFMYDDAFLVGVAANDPNTRLTVHRFLDVPWGHRHPEGRDGDEALGRRGDSRHEGPRHVLGDPEADDSAPLLSDLPEERAEPEGHASLPARQPAREQLP